MASAYPTRAAAINDLGSVVDNVDFVDDGHINTLRRRIERLEGAIDVNENFDLLVATPARQNDGIVVAGEDSTILETDIVPIWIEAISAEQSPAFDVISPNIVHTQGWNVGPNGVRRDTSTHSLATRHEFNYNAASGSTWAEWHVEFRPAATIDGLDAWRPLAVAIEVDPTHATLAGNTSMSYTCDTYSVIDRSTGATQTQTLKVSRGLLQMADSGGTLRTVINTGASNIIKLGVAATAMELYGSSLQLPTSGALVNAGDLTWNPTSGSIKFGTDASHKLGFWNTTPVAQYSTAGTTTGFTAGVGTAVLSDSTFTGGSGTKAYTVGDIVLALKTCGIMAAS